MSSNSQFEFPPLVILCSLGTQTHEQQMPAALRDRFRLVFVDVRGSGASPEDAATLTFDAVAEDLDRLRTELGVTSIAVFGHSILGALAIEAARRRPAAISHVIAVGTPPFGDMARLAHEAALAFEREASAERKAILAVNLAALPAGASPGQVMFAETPKRFFDAHFDATPLFAGAVMRPEFFAHLFGRLLPSWHVSASSSASEPPLRTPLLLALGKFDFVSPPALWSELVPELPNATVEIFERSGHQPFFEQPERFAEVVASWMAESR